MRDTPAFAAMSSIRNLLGVVWRFLTWRLYEGRRGCWFFDSK
jgi:hypothetical protein